MGRPKKNIYKNEEPISKRFSLPAEITQKIWGILIILAAIVITLSFFSKAGVAGQYFLNGARFLIGESVYVIPFVFILAGLALLDLRKALKNKALFWPTLLASLLILMGATGILGLSNLPSKGGVLGYAVSYPFLNFFGWWAAIIILAAPVIIGLLIFWQFLKPVKEEVEEIEEVESNNQPETNLVKSSEPSLMKKLFAPKFRVKEITHSEASPSNEKPEEKQAQIKFESKPSIKNKSAYVPPPVDLLERAHGNPTSGDTKVNSSIIKKTLQNFGIDVAMAEINIGPTVTQYTFKPAEGVKLSKITTLSNDLSLALASHPIRIEAPVPGRALVGVEIPNKVRAQVRLREMIEDNSFQKSPSNLGLPLGKDVSGSPIYADIARMPHMLVAGSTGTGKTIFLNNIITSLLYQPTIGIKNASPEFLRLVLIDPKRVEFPVYSSLPHLLCPIIYNATQTVIALKWLTAEMERRFDVLATARCRDIGGYNEKAIKEGGQTLPFIIVIIDELADLMMAKGREIEAGIVRLAQMARAVGIHLIVATQRPSVEVITGLIKANITSRVTFLVASQVDSRTVIDTSGAEKLLGAGDMLHISASWPKPKRIQSPYISEKEVKKVIEFITENNADTTEAEMNPDLVLALERGMEEPEKEGEQSSSFYGGDEDPLFVEAKKIVIDAKKASASLLQRRLRLGYARAARLIDMLEEKGIVGPSDGAKPREVYSNISLQNPTDPTTGQLADIKPGEGIPVKTEDGWNKI